MILVYILLTTRVCACVRLYSVCKYYSLSLAFNHAARLTIGLLRQEKEEAVYTYIDGGDDEDRKGILL